jgi:hypothetical protein
MGKVTFEFDLDTEAVEIRTHMDSTRWKTLAWNLNQHLMRIIKYSDKNAEQYEKTLEKLNELMIDYNLSFDD